MVRHIAIGKDDISAKLLEMVGSDLFVHKSIISISKSRANTSVGFSHTRQIGGAFEPSCDGLDMYTCTNPMLRPSVLIVA